LARAFWLEGLRELQKVGLPASLYRVDDHAVAKLGINTETASGMNAACG
jgi:hypothetical protein